jgi:flagellin-like protein
MQGKGRRKQRRAVSPVLATVILIAITLIAAVAIAGFVFGLFGAFTSTAQVSITSVSCRTNGLCTLTLTNSGTASTYSGTSGTITFGGKTVTMTCGTTTSASPVSPTSVLIAAGGSNQISCSFDASSAQAGQQFVGTVSLANGGQVQFSGTFGS